MLAQRLEGLLQGGRVGDDVGFALLAEHHALRAAQPAHARRPARAQPTSAIAATAAAAIAMIPCVSVIEALIATS